MSLSFRAVLTIALVSLLPGLQPASAWAQGGTHDPAGPAHSGAVHSGAAHSGAAHTGHGHMGSMAGPTPADAASPYAGLEQREIKALSPNEVQDLLRGAGMGLAKAAELNRYPGPRHVLDLALKLELSTEQRSATQALFDSMQAEAVALGTAIVERERELDARFTQGSIDAEALAHLTAEIGRLQGTLRATHLRAHLEMRRLLTERQTAAYSQLRGYASR